jgi:hypothetical protein
MVTVKANATTVNAVDRLTWLASHGIGVTFEGYEVGMPIGSQPKRRRGTVGHPYSPLNLRFVLASFGLVICGALGAVLLWRGAVVIGVLALVLAVIAVVDLAVIQQRRRQRRRTDPREHSLFQ